jgi:hypothetical protein
MRGIKCTCESEGEFISKQRDELLNPAHHSKVQKTKLGVTAIAAQQL